MLLLSPHLDDAVFSLGALAADLARRGQSVTTATVFTATVPNPTGFALRCQTDKGYAPEVDYMALRRSEDLAACALLGVTAEHWGFAEAPHRGYGSPEALFAGMRAGDGAEVRLVDALAERIAAVLTERSVDTVAYPVGAGNHVDHLLLIAAVERVRARFPDIRWLQWLDQPYAARQGGKGLALLARIFDFAKTVGGLAEVGAEWCAFDWSGGGDELLARKWRACAAYASQVGYQFYGAVGEERPVGADDAARISEVLGGWEWVRTV